MTQRFEPMPERQRNLRRAGEDEGNGVFSLDEFSADVHIEQIRRSTSYLHTDSFVVGALSLGLILSIFTLFVNGEMLSSERLYFILLAPTLALTGSAVGYWLAPRFGWWRPCAGPYSDRQ